VVVVEGALLAFHHISYFLRDAVKSHPMAIS